MKRTVAVTIAALLVPIFVSCLGLACHRRVDHPSIDYYWYGGEVGLLGDINTDGRIDQADLEIINQGFGTVSDDPNFNACADLNADGLIDDADREILDQLWNKTGFYVRHDPSVEISRSVSWLSGSWQVEPETGLVTVDCAEVGVEWTTPLQPNSSRVRVLSAGDVIEDYQRYRSEPLANIEHTKTDTSITWWTTYSPVSPLSEGWTLTIRDDGDRRVILEFHVAVDRIISEPPGEWDVVVQTIEICW